MKVRSYWGKATIKIPNMSKTTKLIFIIGIVSLITLLTFFSILNTWIQQDGRIVIIRTYVVLGFPYFPIILFADILTPIVRSRSRIKIRK
ncbi:MAG: hypothetical protein ACREBI_11510 [Nitrosotalea sp.]